LAIETWGSYARSKLANVLYARELHARKQWPVAAVHPGTVNTPLAKAMSPNFSSINVFDIFQQLYIDLVLRSAENSAAVVLQAAVPEKANGGYINGLGNLVPAEKLPRNAGDDVTAKRLWDITEKIIKAHRAH
jgi:NAD(P)-dependent dehydrogenase (short-subunit alcohol dehydrogenase family)